MSSALAKSFLLLAIHKTIFLKIEPPKQFYIYFHLFFFCIRITNHQFSENFINLNQKKIYLQVPLHITSTNYSVPINVANLSEVNFLTLTFSESLSCFFIIAEGLKIIPLCDSQLAGVSHTDYDHSATFMVNLKRLIFSQKLVAKILEPHTWKNKFCDHVHECTGL